MIPNSELVATINEGSAATFTATFRRVANGDLLPPATVKWTLTDEKGNVINNRQNVEVTPASSVTILISGDDTMLTAAEEKQGHVERQILVQATYDSEHGMGLPLNSVGRFYIKNIKAIKAE